jgi:thymidylate synthase (FAD)
MAVSNVQKTEINDLQDQTYPTKRATVPELEDILYDAHPVLDHGFVRVIDYMGDDAAIVQAARVSYGRGTKKLRQDKGLINYLLRHRHTTPFEMCEIKFHIKMPVFIARQWIRHRTANVNEYSARYSVLDREFYIPSAEQLAAQSSQNNQGRSDQILSAEESARVLEILKADSQQCYDHYIEMMNKNEEGETIDEGKQGLARELARMNLPVNVYTQWYWKVDLHNLLHFLSLRADPHAQYEIRVYAEIMLDMVKKWVPHTYEAFMQYHMGGTHLSASGLEIIKKMIKGEKVTQEDSGMSPREWRELMATIED